MPLHTIMFMFRSCSLSEWGCRFSPSFRNVSFPVRRLHTFAFSSFFYNINSGEAAKRTRFPFPGTQGFQAEYERLGSGCCLRRGWEAGERLISCRVRGADAASSMWLTGWETWQVCGSQGWGFRSQADASQEAASQPLKQEWSGNSNCPRARPNCPPSARLSGLLSRSAWKGNCFALRW